MRITHVTIYNFRNIRALELDLTDANFLVGMNGAGKSSVINAIQMLLCGWCQHTDRSGKGYRDLVGPHADYARIAADIDDYSATLTLGAKREYECINRETGEIIDTQQAFLRACGIDPLAALLTMYPRQIVCSREFSTLLIDYLSSTLSADDIEMTLPADKRGMVRDFARSWNIKLSSVTGYEDLGAKAYDRRRDVSGELKHVKKTLESIGFVKPAQGDIPSLHKQHDDLLMQRGAAMAASTDDPAPLRLERSELMERLQKAEAFAQAKRVYDDADRARLDAAHQMGALKPIESICPTCARKLPANTLKTLQEQYQDEFAALQASVDRAAALRDEAQAAMWQAETNDDASEIRNRLTELRILIDRAEAGYIGPTVEELDASIVSLEAQINAVRAYSDHQALTAQVKAMTEEYDRLDWMVKQFHDGALLTGLMLDAANAIMAQTGEPIDVRAEGKWLSVYYDGRPLDHASEGQKAMVSYRLALAFAHCGAPVLMDDINDLDPVHRTRLIRYLTDVSAGTVIIAGTPLVGQVTALAQEIKPMQLIRVANGDAATVTGE